MDQFKKNEDLFPVTKDVIYLNNCGVAAMSGPASKAASVFLDHHSKKGADVFFEYPNILGQVREAGAELMKCRPENVSFLKNTAEGLSMIAAGYPFEPGDEIISYMHEYPSNHYPWKLQESRGARLKLIEDHKIISSADMAPAEDQPQGLSFETIRNAVTDKTKIIALSHVQFTSGFALDLVALGDLCRQKGIDLIIDAAQSLGSLPVYPEQFGIAAVAASGWKWMMGPLGTGLLFTSPELRSKLNITMAGADLMHQGQDYLNHEWSPVADSRMFEYSTASVSLATGLEASLRNIHLQSSAEEIRSEIFRLQDLFISHLKSAQIRVLIHKEPNRSGILSLYGTDTETLSKKLKEKNIMATVRGGYLRIAPHVFNTNEDMERAAEAINHLVP